MIYDCFPFFNELELLELRLEELCEVVDCFVLIEAPKTFSGNPKPLYFQENRHLFQKHAAKIRHVVVDDLPIDAKSAWDLETFQRNAILRGLGDAQPDDYVIISDVDEIPRAETIGAFDGELAALETDLFYYKLNCRNLTVKWNLSCITKRKHLSTPQEARGGALMCKQNGIPLLPNAGWHFSYAQASPEGIKLKVQSFSHQELNTREFTEEAAIARRMRYGLDPFDRRDQFYACVPLDASFPAYLLSHQEDFRELLFDFTQFHLERLELIYSLQDELLNAKKTISQILDSRSWRITEPFRRLMALLH